MDSYEQIFSPGSSSSPSLSLGMVNPRNYFHVVSANGVRADTKTQHSDHRNVSEGGTSSSCEINVKSGVKDGGNYKEVRKHKYAFQTRSQVDILDDGYRWRKYGQKTVKNSKFPRSYYKCTQKGCSVKKQVQRSTKDEEVVVTTYEGMHTHPTERFTDNFEQILRQMQTYAPL